MQCHKEISDDASLREDYLLMVWGHIMGDKGGREKHKMTGHRASTVRKQIEMNTGAQLIFFIFVQASHGVVSPTFMESLSSSVNPI